MGIASNVCVCLRSAAKVLRRRLPSASGRGSYSQFRYPSPAFCIMVMLFVSTIIPHITSETYFKNVKKSYEAAYAEYHRAAAADRAALAGMCGPPGLPPPPLKVSIATPQPKHHRPAFRHAPPRGILPPCSCSIARRAAARFSPS